MIWDFNDFYNNYQKKVKKKEAQTAWVRHVGTSIEIRKKIMEHVPLYVASTPEKKYRMHPATYLNGECWEDEIIEKQTKSNWGDAANGLIDHLKNVG